MASFESVRRELRGAFVNGRLELLVGAGASVSSGLPTWNELNRRLLRRFLSREYQDLDFQQHDLDPAAEIFVSGFGREAVVDLVRARLGKREYAGLLREALYGGGAQDVSSIHLEIAAMLGAGRQLNRVFTFNFDELLERASERFPEWRAIAATGAPSRGRAKQVTHLHGYLPAVGSQQGEIVLSERDYYEAEGDWASRALRRLFEDPNAVVLMVGLSLSDSRLRRLLLDRIERSRRGKPVARVIALLSASPEPQWELIERLARRFVRQHATSYWKAWGISVVQLDAHDLVPFHLRQIRLGNAPERWAREARQYLWNAVPTFRRLYSRGEQLRILSILAEVLRLVRRRYAVRLEEEVHLGGYIPGPNACLQLGFCHRGGERAEEDVVGPDRARARSLQIAALPKVQGASGRAFVLGATIGAKRGDPLLDLNFTPQMHRDWTQERTFSALLSVPIYDSPRWLPVGVMYLTSNHASPFWDDLSPRDLDELQTLLRNTFGVAVELPGEAAA